MQLNDPTLFRQQALINGRWRDASSKETLAVTNPANGQQLGSVPKMGAAETREAIDAAAGALPAWRALTAKERSAILRRWFELMMEHQDDLARLMTLEQVNRWQKQKVKSATPPPLSSGLPKRASASTAIPYPAIRPTSGCW